jgi:hypothetical protein
MWRVIPCLACKQEIAFRCIAPIMLMSCPCDGDCQKMSLANQITALVQRAMLHTQLRITISSHCHFGYCFEEWHLHWWIPHFSPSKAKNIAIDMVPMTRMPAFEYLWEVWHSKMGILLLCTFEPMFHFHKQMSK